VELRKIVIWRRQIIKFLIEKKEVSFPDSFSFQQFLAEYAKTFKGKYRLELDRLYRDKGFLEKDKKLLFSYSRSDRLRALRRIEDTGIALPLAFLEQFLSHRDTFFATAVLFNMIKTHKNKAAPYVFSFFHGHQDYSKGILFNILKYYGKVDAGGLKFLLERVEEESFQEALLTAIYYSPVEDVDETVFHSVKNSSPLENKIMALKILDQYKSERTLKLMKILARQKEWILKIYIAKLMHSYDYQEVHAMLKSLLEEENFHVRSAACKALMNFRPLSNHEIESILIDSGHPSREILHHELSVEQVETNYVA
jgi:hypothetical protein